MRRSMVALLVIGMVSVPAVVSAGPPGDPFVGSWHAIDSVDGSNIWLRVGGGRHHAVYSEDGLTACDNAFGEFVRGSASGFAVIDGDTMSLTATLYCNLSTGRTAHPVLAPYTFVFEYDESTDTLTMTDPSLGADETSPDRGDKADQSPGAHRVSASALQDRARSNGSTERFADTGAMSRAIAHGCLMSRSMSLRSPRGSGYGPNGGS